MLPIGQALWLKELETYEAFPPLQDPASYNLDQVIQQIKTGQDCRSQRLTRTDHESFGGRRLQAPARSP